MSPRKTPCVVNGSEGGTSDAGTSDTGSLANRAPGERRGACPQARLWALPLPRTYGTLGAPIRPERENRNFISAP